MQSGYSGWVVLFRRVVNRIYNIGVVVVLAVQPLFLGCGVGDNSNTAGSVGAPKGMVMMGSELSAIDGTSDVAVDASFGYTFLKNIAPATVTSADFFVVPYQSNNISTPSKGLYSSAICNSANAVEASVECYSLRQCVLTPSSDLSANTSYAICLSSGTSSYIFSKSATVQRSGIFYTDFTPFEGVMYQFTTAGGGSVVSTSCGNGTCEEGETASSCSADCTDEEVVVPSCTAPTCSAIHAAIISGNATGIRPGLTFNSVVLPNFECSGITPSVTISGLPEHFAFSASTRTLSGGVIPEDAITGNTITYTESNTSASVSCLLEDSDEDTILDYIEYAYSEVPLVNNSIGWIWLDSATALTYRSTPTGLVVPLRGLNLNDATDAVLDFDMDGVNNASELLAGTNLFVARSGGTFLDVVNYNVGTFPGGTVNGDFDGDGDLDIAVGISDGADTHNVSILLGNGDGTFAEAVVYSVDQWPGSMVTGDFNGDGKLDLATIVSNGVDTHNISVLLGNGDGTFAEAVNYSIDWAGSLITSDLNGDGYLDLVASLSDGTDIHKISILIGNGNGTFADAVDYALDLLPAGIMSGDFDRDGNIDLVVGTSDGSTIFNVSILIGNGDGTFAEAVPYEIDAGPGSLVVGDLDGDGDADIAVCNGSYVSILFGDGDGTLSGLTKYNIEADLPGMTVGDFDGNGSLDLAPTVTDWGGISRISILLNADSLLTGGLSVTDGSGSVEIDSALTVEFSGDITIPADWNDVFTLKKDGIGDTLCTSVDYNAETHIATCVHSNLELQESYVLKASGLMDSLGKIIGVAKSTFTTPNLFAATIYNVGDVTFSSFAITSGEFNGDGNIDLIMAVTNLNEIYMLAGNGDGTFASPSAYSVGAGPLGMVTGDFDGDGNLDLVTANGNGGNNISVLIGNGDGTFDTAVNYTGVNSPQHITAADFNGDGALDLAVANGGTDNISVFIGDGDGTFAAAVNYVTVNRPYSIVSGDFNGDGNVDLAVVSLSSSTVSVFVGNGDGTFDSSDGYIVSSTPYAAASGDFNEDERADLATANYLGYDISLLIQDEGGLFNPAVDNFETNGSNNNDIVVGDFNGDGHLDIATSWYSWGARIYIGNGDGTFERVINHEANSLNYGITAGDFDGDGDIDLAESSVNSTNNLTILLNQSN